MLPNFLLLLIIPTKQRDHWSLAWEVEKVLSNSVLVVLAAAAAVVVVFHI